MVSRALGLQMADSRVARKLGSPCIAGETAAGNFLGSHGDLATEVGRGAVGSGHEMSHFPPRRGISHWQEQVCELPDGQAPSPVVGRGVGFQDLPGGVSSGEGAGHPWREEERKERGREEEGRGKEGEWGRERMRRRKEEEEKSGGHGGARRRGDSVREDEGEQREVGLGRVLTEPSEQLSDSVSLKRIKSLMKTETALRMKDTKRCMWM